MPDRTDTAFARRKRIWYALAAAWLVALSGACAAGFAETSSAPASAPSWPAELTPATRAALERGLAWLAQAQLPDGSFTGSSGGNTGVVSLAVLSFLSTGHLPERGPRGEAVMRGIEFVVRHAQPGGVLSNPADTSGGVMYEHGLSTLMLGEVCGECERPQVVKTLRQAVQVILASQNAEGGWRYQPRPADADVSVTATQLVALRAAKDAGMSVPAEAVRAGLGYVKRCTAPGGGFLYQPGGSGVAYPRTAAAVCALLACGEYQAKEVSAGIVYLQENRSAARRGPAFTYYGLYYAAQAMRLAPNPRDWQQWYPSIREELLAVQKPDGHWDGEAGPVYGTSAAILVLSIPYGYLPVHQR